LNHELAAMITATPSSANAIPSRRCPGSMWRAWPIDRAALPVPLAATIQLARAARPQARPVITSKDWLRRLAGRLTRLTGLLGRFLGARGDALDRPLAAPAREVAPGLLVRVPERAVVLLAMPASVVASTTSAPPATLVTEG
jgi:hypothetical protein